MITNQTFRIVIITAILGYIFKPLIDFLKNYSFSQMETGEGLTTYKTITNFEQAIASPNEIFDRSEAKKLLNIIGNLLILLYKIYQSSVGV
jgi:hypothetical protein